MIAIRRFFASLSVALVYCALLIGNHAAGQGSTPSVPAQATKADYENVPPSVVIDVLEQLSGKHYIRDANLASLPPVTVKAGSLSKDDAVRLLTATLSLNGIAILPVDDHTMKAITAGTNKNPRSEGLRIYTNVADLSTDDEIVTYFMALDHIDPQEAAGIFTQVAPVHVYGAYVPAPSAQGVILTENASVTRELIDLKKSIDISKTPNVIPRSERAGPPPGPAGKPGFPPPPPPATRFSLFWSSC